MRKSGMTKLEVLVAVSLVAFMLVGGCLYPYALVRNAKMSLGCQSKLKHMGLLMRIYAYESPGEHFPPLLVRGFERTDGSMQTAFALGMDPTSVYPEFLADHYIFLCYFDWYPAMDDDHFLAADGTSLFNEWRGPEGGGPLTANGNPCSDSRSCIHAVDFSYWYLGFVFDRMEPGDPATGLDPLHPAMAAIGGDPSINGHVPAQLVHAFEEILVQRFLPALEAGDFEGANSAAHSDLSAPAGQGNNNGNTVYRLRVGVARFLITDTNSPGAELMAESIVPVMWDRVPLQRHDFSHQRPLGGNVLYFDGHTDFVPYPGPAPMHEGIAHFGAALGR